MSEMSLQEVCRLCLSKDNLVWVFDTRLDRTDHMKDVILITTGVEIHSKDVISQKICTKCGQDVIKMFQFRQQSQKNDSHLKEQCRRILKSTDLKIPNTNVTIKTEKVDKEEIKQETTYRKPSYKVHPSMTALSRKYPQLQFPSICLLSNVDPCVSMEMDAVERYFRSRNLNMNEYVQSAIASDKNKSKKSSDNKKSPVRSKTKIGPINIKLVQSEYKIVKYPRKRRHSGDSVSEPVKKIPSTDPCPNISQNTVIKPDVQMKNDNILASLGNKVPNLETITDLLANIGNLQSMSNNEYTQTELPTPDSIEVNDKKNTAELKNLKPVLLSHKIPVLIRYGPQTVSYSFKLVPPKSNNLKFWNNLTPIDIKPNKQAIGDPNPNSGDVNTETLAPHSDDNTEANIPDKAKSSELTNDHESVQNNATVVLNSSEPHETQSSQGESFDLSTSAPASTTVPILASLLTTPPQSNPIEKQIPDGKNLCDFQGGIFDSLEITPVPATAPIRRNSYSPTGTDQTPLRSETVIRSISNYDSRDGSPKQAVAPMSNALNSIFSSICSDSRVISPLQAKSPEIGHAHAVNPFQISNTRSESYVQRNPPVSYGFNYNSTSYINAESQVQSHRQVEASHVMGGSTNSITASNYQHEFSDFATIAAQVPSGGNGGNSSASKVGVQSTKQRHPRIKVFNKPNKNTMQENTAGQFQGITNYYNNNFPGIAYSHVGSRGVFDNTTSLQNTVLHNNTFHQPRMPPPPYPTTSTPAIRRNLPQNLPYPNASNGARTANFHQYQVEESLRTTTIRSNDTFYPPNPLYSANTFNASNLLRHMRPLENRKACRPPGVSETSGGFDLTAHSKYASSSYSSSVYASVTVNSRYQNCAPSEVATTHTHNPAHLSTAIDSFLSSNRQPSGSIRVRNVCELT